MDGWDGWDISLTPPTTRAPLAVLTITIGQHTNIEEEKLNIGIYRVLHIFRCASFEVESESVANSFFGKSASASANALRLF